MNVQIFLVISNVVSLISLVIIAGLFVGLWAKMDVQRNVLQSIVAILRAMNPEESSGKAISYRLRILERMFHK